MEGMAQFPDGYFDLAIVDPPYGIGEDGKSNHSRNKAFGSKSLGDKNSRKQIIQSKKYVVKNWDKYPPDVSYFIELQRVSKHQIIWGANHFISRIPHDSPCWIVWDKDNSGDFADCELAYTSFRSAVRKFRWRWNGMLQEKMGDQKEVRIHPTQKPVPLYKWLLSSYGKPRDKILDTHAGSCSSLIACMDMGFDFIGFEIDADYYQAASKRIEAFKSQLKLF
jgi:site-specific DNA-methyltransferase (adenine-specific)